MDSASQFSIAKMQQNLKGAQGSSFVNIYGILHIYRMQSIGLVAPDYIDLAQYLPKLQIIIE